MTEPLTPEEIAACREGKWPASAPMLRLLATIDSERAGREAAEADNAALREVLEGTDIDGARAIAERTRNKRSLRARAEEAEARAEAAEKACADLQDRLGAIWRDWEDSDDGYVSSALIDPILQIINGSRTDVGTNYVPRSDFDTVVRERDEARAEAERLRDVLGRVRLCFAAAPPGFLANAGVMSVLAEIERAHHG